MEMYVLVFLKSKYAKRAMLFFVTTLEIICQPLL